MKKYIVASAVLNIAIMAIVINILKPHFWEERISVGFEDWIFLLFVILTILLVKLFTFPEKDQKGLKFEIANVLLYEKLIITLLVIVLLLFSIGGNKSSFKGTKPSSSVTISENLTISLDTIKKTEINPKKLINDEKKDEVADTKRKLQLPNEVNLKKSMSVSVQEADIKMSQLKNKGFVHLGQVHSINEKKKWKVTQSYTQYKKDDDFYLNYYSKTINISGLKMLIFDDTNFGNGTISKTPHDYKVIGDIVLVNQGDYEDAWLFVELKK